MIMVYIEWFDCTSDYFLKTGVSHLKGTLDVRPDSD